MVGSYILIRIKPSETRPLSLFVVIVAVVLVLLVQGAVSASAGRHPLLATIHHWVDWADWALAALGDLAPIVVSGLIVSVVHTSNE